MRRKDREVRLSFLSRASLFRSSIVYLLATGLSAGAPLVLLPILTRALSPDEYGQIAMFSVAAQIFGIMTGLSTHGAVAMKYFDLSPNFHPPMSRVPVTFEPNGLGEATGWGAEPPA